MAAVLIFPSREWGRKQSRSLSLFHRPCSQAPTRSLFRKARRFATRSFAFCSSGRNSKCRPAFTSPATTSLNSVIYLAAGRVFRRQKTKLSAVSNIDPEAFRDFERRGWEEIASRYDGGFAAVTTQSVTAL